MGVLGPRGLCGWFHAGLGPLGLGPLGLGADGTAGWPGVPESPIPVLPGLFVQVISSAELFFGGRAGSSHRGLAVAPWRDCARLRWKPEIGRRPVGTGRRPPLFPREGGPPPGPRGPAPGVVSLSRWAGAPWLRCLVALLVGLPGQAILLWSPGASSFPLLLFSTAPFRVPTGCPVGESGLLVSAVPAPPGRRISPAGRS